MSMATALDTLRDAKRIVVKVGSALIAADGVARQDWLNVLAADIAAWRKAGQEIVLVSSGAIALGRNQLGPDRLFQISQRDRCIWVLPSS